MSGYNLKSASQSFRDPSTFIQRPISAKTPDVSHILTSVFGELYTKDVLTTDVIKNLAISSDVEDQYHKRYVNKLKEAQLIKENRIQEYAMLEKHILEAQAKALAYEEREDEKRRKICSNPDEFGVPPAKSFFSHCLDDALLKEHGLLVPSDYYYKNKQPFCPMPKSELPDGHLRETIASRARNLAKSSIIEKFKARTPTISDIEELHKSGSEMSDDAKSLFSDDEDNDKKKPFWKDSIRQESRARIKEDLKKLENKIRYLPNPRLEAIRTEKTLHDLQNTLEINPSQILFTNYTIGKVYETSFEVRNITLISHQIRVLPPKTQYFTLSLGQYPQSQSVIAPGLGAIYNIRFAPDSLCTYEDEVTVECSNGFKISVLILARRESPSLSIGSEIDCGQALVGQIKVCRYLIQNEGGDGRFVVLPKSSWPGSTFKTNVSSSNLSLPPFEIQPSIFELRKRDVFALEVVFKPPDTKRYEQDIIISCDNCTTIEFKIIGQGELAEIEYFQQEDDFSSSFLENSILIDEYKDVLSNKIIRFPSLNPNVYTRKRFSIRNKSASPIDYSWFIYKPIMEDNLLMEPNSRKLSYVIDKDAFFSVAPRQGTLDRNDTKIFEIMFSPARVGSFNNVAHFVMHGIPEINKQLVLNKGDEIHKTVLSKEDMTITDLIGAIVELKAECEPFQFTLDPPAIFIPGSTYMHSTARKAFRLINMSICPINFNWRQIVDSHVIQVEPSYGEIAPKSYALMEALITGTKPGKLVDDIACFVEFSDEPIYLHIEADIKGPEMIIQEAGLDFGLVQIGTICKSFITIENISNLPLTWNLLPLSHQELFRFPLTGSMQPLEFSKIEVSFIPKQEIILNTQFEFKIEDSTNLLCNCYAQAQRPSASFLESQLTLSNLFVNVPDIVIVKLCNHSILEAQFNWGPPEGEDAPNFEFIIEPKMGVLKSKSLLECQIHIKPNSLCNLNDLRIPCYIQEMIEPLFLNLIGTVKGVSVCYYYSDLFHERESQLNNSSVIDFGDVKVGEEVQKYLNIKNMSGINTTIELDIKTFKTIEQVSKNEQDKSLFYDPLQKKSKLADKYKVKDSTTGVGFIIDKPKFTLPAFGSVKFSIAVLCEIWGSYEDVLIINIEGIDQEDTIPMKLNIIDCPFKLFSSKVSEDEKEEISMIRFGSQVQGSGVIKRNLKIQNLSWIPIEINWKIFIVEPSDKKLIDVNLLYDDISEADLIKLANFQQNKPNASQKQQITNRSNYSNRDPLPSIRSSDNSFDLNDNDTYVYVEQLSLVNLNLTKHYGIELEKSENSVFSLNKTKFNMKPREKAIIEVFFNTATTNCQSYEAVFVGYFNLDPIYCKGSGFERKLGFEKDPICFKVTAQLDSPNLILELNDDLHFDVALGDLIHNKKELIDERIFKNQFSLLNNSLAPIEFNLAIKEPFYFQNFINLTQRYHLKPKTKHKVDVLFKFNTDLISQLNFNGKSSLTLAENVVVNYSKDLNQMIPISAKVMAPELKTTKDFIDFGISLVGQERCQQFSLRNPSSSSFLWKIQIENNYSGAFDCNVKSGFLEASQFYIKTTEQIVSVYFTAKHSEAYNSKLIITTEPSNEDTEPVEIILSGMGTYDQSSEAILNI